MVRFSLLALGAMVASAPGVAADFNTVSVTTGDDVAGKTGVTLTFTGTVADVVIATDDSITIAIPMGYTIGATPACTSVTVAGAGNTDITFTTNSAIDQPTSIANGELVLTAPTAEIGTGSLVFTCDGFTNPSRPITGPTDLTTKATDGEGDKTTTWPDITAGTMTTTSIALSSTNTYDSATATVGFTTSVPLIAGDKLIFQFHAGTTFSGVECKFTSTTSGATDTDGDGKSGGLSCESSDAAGAAGTDATDIYQTCTLQMAEAVGIKTVKCTGITNPVITDAVNDLTITAIKTGGATLDSDTGITGAAIVAADITTIADIALSNDSASETTSATLTFTLAGAALAAGDTMELVADFKATGDIADLNCHSTTIGLKDCAYTAGDTKIECTITATVMGDYGAELAADLSAGSKTVICEGLTNVAAGAEDATGTLKFGRGDYTSTAGGKLLSSGAGVTRPAIFAAITGTKTMVFSSYAPGALTTATVSFTPSLATAVGDKLVVEFPAGTTFKHTAADGTATAVDGDNTEVAISDTDPASNPAETDFCSMTTGLIEFSKCVYVAPHLTCTTSVGADANVAQVLECVDVVYAPQSMVVSQHLQVHVLDSTDTDGTTVNEKTMSVALTKTGTYTGHTRNRMVCVAGGAIPAGDNSGDVPAFVAASFTKLEGRSPICVYQGGDTAGKKTPTLAGNHAGHRFIEWDNKICAAGGGSFEYWKSAAAADDACTGTSAGGTCTSAVSKTIECWDKNPNHGWVEQDMPGGDNAGGVVYEGSAPVTWRGMICLTGGATTDVTRSVAADGTYGEYDNLADASFVNTVTCTADGSSWAKQTGTLQAKRAFHSAATFGGNMCVSGGYNYGTSASTVTMLSSVECTTDGEAWSYLAALSQARAYHTMFVFQGELCTVGGTTTHKFALESFPLECTNDGRNWIMSARDDTNNGIVHSGVSVDPDGTFFVPVLSSNGGLDAYRSYSRYNGWTSIALQSVQDTNKGRYHMPATFSFQQNGAFLSPADGDYN